MALSTNKPARTEVHLRKFLENFRAACVLDAKRSGRPQNYASVLARFEGSALPSPGKSTNKQSTQFHIPRIPERHVMTKECYRKLSTN